jgi:hypothetical protein
MRLSASARTPKPMGPIFTSNTGRRPLLNNPNCLWTMTFDEALFGEDFETA